MTQAQLDFQTQLEQTSSDLTTNPLFNDSLVLFLETMDQTQTNTNPTHTPEQAEHEQNTSKVPTPPDNRIETPPPPKKRYEILKDPLFLSSPVFPPTIPSKPSHFTNRDDHLIPLLLQDNFVFKAQLTSLYMNPTNYTFLLYDKNQDFFTSIAAKIMSPNHYWLDNGLKIFSLQFNFLRPSIYDLKTDESDPSFLSVAQKVSHHQTYTKFLQQSKPQNCIFVNYKYTSPYTMTNLCTIDHSRITGSLRNYDPIKQYFYLLPFNDTSRPLIVPQEYLIHFDDFLLPCNIPTQSVKPLTVIKHLVSSPLDDKDKSYYTALSKQSYSYNELLFISAKFISYMVQTDQKIERKPPTTEPTSPIRNAPEKLSYVLNNRILREIDLLMEPYKQNSSDSTVTTLTRLVHSDERIHKLLQSLDIDSQRITQSSKTITSTLTSLNNICSSITLH